MEDPKRISFEEYERMEALSDDRLEYYDGVVVRTESPSMQHELIVTNVGDALAAATRQAGCRKFTNATVITPGRPHGFKPDLAISCDAVDLGPGAHQRACRLRSPSLIVEVLSSLVLPAVTVFVFWGIGIRLRGTCGKVDRRHAGGGKGGL